MKRLRKNIDLDNLTLTILQVQSILEGFGTLKPYLEEILSEKAQKCLKERPDVFGSLISKEKSKQGKQKSKQQAKTMRMSSPIKRR